MSDGDYLAGYEDGMRSVLPAEPPAEWIEAMAIAAFVQASNGTRTADHFYDMVPQNQEAYREEQRAAYAALREKVGT